MPRQGGTGQQPPRLRSLEPGMEGQCGKRGWGCRTRGSLSGEPSGGGWQHAPPPAEALLQLQNQKALLTAAGGGIYMFLESHWAASAERPKMGTSRNLS